MSVIFYNRINFVSWVKLGLHRTSHMFCLLEFRPSRDRSQVDQLEDSIRQRPLRPGEIRIVRVFRTSEMSLFCSNATFPVREEEVLEPVGKGKDLNWRQHPQ